MVIHIGRRTKLKYGRRGKLTYVHIPLIHADDTVWIDLKVTQTLCLIGGYNRITPASGDKTEARSSSPRIFLK
jgi:hypothetical protein